MPFLIKWVCYIDVNCWDKASDDESDVLTILKMVKHSLGVFFKCSERSHFIDSIYSSANISSLTHIIHKRL